MRIGNFSASTARLCQLPTRGQGRGSGIGPRGRAATATSAGGSALRTWRKSYYQRRQSDGAHVSNLLRDGQKSNEECHEYRAVGSSIPSEVTSCTSLDEQADDFGKLFQILVFLEGTPFPSF